jgi:acyl phosphate:glycerol-3-phosphate acyltransferase
VILIIKLLVIALLAYLLGAIPFGLIISKRLAKVDIRQHGSGNIGATNVFRVLGAGYGLLTAVLDVTKSVVSILLAMFIIGNDAVMVAGYDIHIQVVQILAALMVMVGHNWSVYIGFKGGKGVATFLGGLLIINWIVALAALIAAAIVILITRYVSIGSMIAAVGALFTFAALAILAVAAPVYLIYGLLAAALIIYQHRSNIMRLQAGTEARLGDKKARVK